jgi:hypothetical protein
MGWRYSSTHLYRRRYVEVSGSTTCLGRFTLPPQKEPRHPLNRRMGCQQYQSARLEEETNVLPQPVIKPMVVQPVALVTGLTELSRPSETWRTAIRLMVTG